MQDTHRPKLRWRERRGLCLHLHLRLLLGDLSVRERAKVVSFSCGTGRLPADGFKGLGPSFCISVDDKQPKENLPSSHTCFNQLVLPPYTSREVLEKQMKKAVGYASQGFGFV